VCCSSSSLGNSRRSEKRVSSSVREPRYAMAWKCQPKDRNTKDATRPHRVRINDRIGCVVFKYRFNATMQTQNEIHKMFYIALNYMTARRSGNRLDLGLDIDDAILAALIVLCCCGVSNSGFADALSHDRSFCTWETSCASWMTSA
jgi:hypothetical protein